MGALSAAEEGKPLMQSGSNTAVYSLDVDARRQARPFLGLPASVFAGACYCTASMSMVSRLLRHLKGVGVLPHPPPPPRLPARLALPVLGAVLPLCLAWCFVPKPFSSTVITVRSVQWVEGGAPCRAHPLPTEP